MALLSKTRRCSGAMTCPSAVGFLGRTRVTGAERASRRRPRLSHFFHRQWRLVDVITRAGLRASLLSFAMILVAKPPALRWNNIAQYGVTHRSSVTVAAAAPLTGHDHFRPSYRQITVASRSLKFPSSHVGAILKRYLSQAAQHEHRLEVPVSPRCFSRERWSRL